MLAAIKRQAAPFRVFVVFKVLTNLVILAKPTNLAPPTAGNLHFFSKLDRGFSSIALKIYINSIIEHQSASANNSKSGGLINFGQIDQHPNSRLRRTIKQLILNSNFLSDSHRYCQALAYWRQITGRLYFCKLYF